MNFSQIHSFFDLLRLTFAPSRQKSFTNYLSTMGVIKYYLKSRKNPVTKEQQYHAQKMNVGANTITTKEMFAAMADYAHVPPAQIPAAFNAIVSAIEAFCLNGHSVKFPELGSFHIRISSSGTATEEAFSMENVRAIRMRFTPVPQLVYELRANTQFERVDFKRSK